MSGVNGADHTPFKSGGVAACELPAAARLPQAIAKGKMRNKNAAQTFATRKVFFMLGLGSDFHRRSFYFLPSAEVAEPYAFWETPPDPAETSGPSGSLTVEQAAK